MGCRPHAEDGDEEGEEGDDLAWRRGCAAGTPRPQSASRWGDGPALGWRPEWGGGSVASAVSFVVPPSGGLGFSGGQEEPRKRGTTNKGAPSLTLGFFWVPVGGRGARSQ